MKAITRITVTAVLAVAALFSASSAHALVFPTMKEIVIPKTVDYGTGVARTCNTAYRSGTQGQYGAWGRYIGGCSMSVQCTSGSCPVSTRSIISTEQYSNNRVTFNSRLLVTNASGTVGWQDKSCDSRNFCRIEDTRVIQAGETATVECNGVHESAANRARATCQINLTRGCYNADTRVDQLSQPVAEANVLCLVNEQRRANGLAALAPNDQLTNAARGHANRAVSIRWWRKNCDTTKDPTCDPHRDFYTASMPADRIAAAGYCPDRRYANSQTTTGENAFWGAMAAPTPREAVDWWMNHHIRDGKPIDTNGHRKAILNPDFTELGNGVVLGNPVHPQDVPSNVGGAFIADFGGCLSL